MLFEQGDMQAVDRHPAFLSCGLMNRIEKLPVLGEIGKLKLLLVGSVLTDNGGFSPHLVLKRFHLRGESHVQAVAMPIQQRGLGDGVEELANGDASLFLGRLRESVGVIR